MANPPAIVPLRPGPLKAAIAAFMDVPVDAINLDHETGSLRKAIARAVRAYQSEEIRWNSPDMTSGKPAIPMTIAANSAAPTSAKRETAGSRTNAPANVDEAGAILTPSMTGGETNDNQAAPTQAEAAE